ncbi:hypothetical protein GCM10007207_15180 [Asaia siamensis]|uniref:Uncharacterized protein n=1 Tax=Asaia siamensis TaxID=110479 RepID=A0ABQ1LYA5_9PROT|nr:hypothetical protein GCM10007207_15180 [Asaia siamensis]
MDESILAMNLSPKNLDLSESKVTLSWRFIKAKQIVLICVIGKSFQWNAVALF